MLHRDGGSEDAAIFAVIVGNLIYDLELRLQSGYV